MRPSCSAPTSRAATSSRPSSTACGSRSSVGFLGVLLAATLGITLGLIAGYVGGRVDAVIMRIADVQLTFPAILIALLVDGVVRGIVSAASSTAAALCVLVFSIGLSFWVQYARTVRGSTMVESNKDYVQAARLDRPAGAGRSCSATCCPTCSARCSSSPPSTSRSPIITEATLSFLGIGMPATLPSLGTLIRIGNNYLFSGEWWIVAFPGIALALLVLAINLLGDWLRDALNPKLR